MTKAQAVLVMILVATGAFGQDPVLSPLSANLLVSDSTLVEAGRTYQAWDSQTSGVAAVAGATVQLTNAKVTVSGASLMDQGSPWGSHAGVLAIEGSNLTLTGGSVKTLGTGTTAVVSDRANVVLANVSLDTTQDRSPGVHASAGRVQAKGLSITTLGADSPALISRGGTLIVTGGTMKTSGADSPALWSQGTLQVTGSVLTATGSAAAVVEGSHSLTLKDTVLVGAKRSGVLLFRTVVEPGSGVFSMSGGSLTALMGPLFSATGPRSVVNLKAVTLVGLSGVLARVAPDPETPGSSADLTLNADNQSLSGDLVVEAAASLSLTLKNASTWTGASDTAGVAQALNISLDAGSVWTVSGDSRVTKLQLESPATQSLVTRGHTIWYKTSANPWLGGKTILLDAGGKLSPY